MRLGSSRMLKNHWSSLIFLFFEAKTLAVPNHIRARLVASALLGESNFRQVPTEIHAPT